MKLYSYLVVFLVLPMSLLADIDYCSKTRSIRDSVSEALCKNHELEVISVSGGMKDCVYFIGLMFEKRKPVSKEEARKIIVESAEFLLQTINSNKSIRPYLDNYPFTISNIEIEIFFRKPDGGDLFDPEIGIVSISEPNEIIYLTIDPINPNQYKSTVKESYKEALEIVKSKQKSVQN